MTDMARIQPVAVKALEWIGIGDADWVATGAFQGVWHIHRNPKNGLFYRVRNDFDNPGFETLNEAIASSQSDYEQRIRSALSTSQSDPAPEIAALRAENDRLREALQNLLGIYDTPLSRRRFPPDDFMKEALAIARAAVALSSKEKVDV